MGEIINYHHLLKLLDELDFKLDKRPSANMYFIENRKNHQKN